MSEWVRARGTPRLLCAAAIAALCSPPALARQPAPQPAPDSAELDLTAPLDAMPDIGVDWPDLAKEAPDDLPSAEPLAVSATVVDANAERQYALAIEGLDRIGNAPELVEAFESESALFENRKEE